MSEALRRAILEHGRVEANLLKVDAFLNHRIEPGLITSIGACLAADFDPSISS